MADKGLIGRKIAAFSVLQPDESRLVLDDRREVRLPETQGFLHLLAVCDVLNGTLVGEDPAFPVPDRSQVEGDPDDRPVLPDRTCFVMFQLAFPFEARQDALPLPGVYIELFGDVGDGIQHLFRRCVAEDVGRGLVEAAIAAVGRGFADAPDGAFKNGSVLLFAPPQGLRGLLVRGDVAGESRRADDGALPVPDGGLEDFKPLHRAVTADRLFAREGLSRLHDVKVFPAELVGQVCGPEVPVRPARDLRRRLHADCPDISRICREVAALPVFQPDVTRHVFNDRRKVRLPEVQGFFHPRKLGFFQFLYPLLERGYFCDRIVACPGPVVHFCFVCLTVGLRLAIQIFDMVIPGRKLADSRAAVK
ncbi:MAG: hypothetical protein A4E73_00902 [Syntrophaceae bacterium PtaU1.Bin231]|nr:MAG: hypothetical protein A4E73_00902 [Syntrophaceae bacterium PtaU1.Bin231]